VNRAFLDILIVLLAAKLAAEGAERLRVPAVVAEILAGIIIGPSMLGLVHGLAINTEGGGTGVGVLQTLGELGVILLLLEVGMHMDLRELRAVGRSALMVAVIGVVLPFITGFAIAEVFNFSTNQALFISASLAATSVGITARVFGDLRALATVEARTVLGAAVADDVIGLVILTIVVKLATGTGSVSAGSVIGTIALAIGFLVITTVVGSYGAPKLFGAIDRVARSSGTLVALALAFTLGIAQLASLAKLAPIVGAFVAGLALGRSAPSQRIQRELTSLGHLFIPVFFLQIGIETNVRQFFKPAVLGLAAGLIVVAIIGKVLAGYGALGSPGNKLLIGIGMIPRGEVGLIFAGVGLREGVLRENSYAAILLMVLVTTIITPPLLAWQYRRVTAGLRDRALDNSPAIVRPANGWLIVRDRGTQQILDLAATPAPEELLDVALHAALQVDRVDPTPALLSWTADAAAHPNTKALRWNTTCTEQFVSLLGRDAPRAWRYLDTTGTLEAAIPELTEAMRKRRLDVTVLDGGGSFSWAVLDRVRRLFARVAFDHPWDRAVANEAQALAHPKRLLLAALLIDATRDDPAPGNTAAPILERLALSPEDRSAIALLVQDQQLLRAAASRHDGLHEDSVLRIAAHLRTHDQARAQYVLSVAMNDLETWEAEQLAELHQLVLASLDGPTLADQANVSLVDRTRDRAMALVKSPDLAERIAAAPLAYLLTEDPESIARHVTLLRSTTQRGVFNVTVHEEKNDEAGALWRVEIAARDQIGLLALVTGVLEEAQLDVLDAVLATWADGAALQAFRVRTDVVGLAPNAKAIKSALTNAQSRELVAAAVADAVITFDGVGSPWHTLAEVRATDRRGLLHALAVAFAAAGADVHSARVATQDSMALDRFDLTDRDGHKLSEDTKAAIRSALINGVVVRPFARRLFSRSNKLGTIPKQT
jgi:Kef-type K+ transport system membrane component KefB